ncbi:oligopeptide ABC transporter substrate-binding protein [Alloiococcus otitis]|uniref:oligopeptide ABC transporter substrate-binding protein n=1 Tax=Alloiococcus otitis TaxID=1652 RepID=UPI002356A094|nr:oligopeptide ABC transporter substrate-binding protein [Alloiococcus otitis]
MSLRKKYAMLVGSASLALLLVACGGESNDGGNGGADTEETTSEETGEEAGQEGEGEGSSEDSGEGDQAASVPEFESTVSNEGDPIDGGVAQVGIVSDTAWTGIFDHQLYQINTDSTIGSYFLGNLLTQDENFALVGGEEWGTAADIEFDEDNATATITVRDGVYWHDGEQVTADDVVFAHEVIGDPDYTGIRYGDEFTNIEGMEEFKAGEADSISGLELSEDQMSVTIHYKDFNPKMTQAGGGVWSYAAPRHYLGDIPAADLESHPNIRENPIGFGPFKVDNVVPGESLELSAFEDYYDGAPKIDGITIERIPVSGAVEALRAGEFDWVDSMPTDQFDTFQDGIPGYTTLGYPGQSYDYLGFKMGEWDSESQSVQFNPDAKMADKNLRQAMGYALDIDRVGETFYNGLRRRANSHIVPNFADFHRDDLEGYPYDPDRANQLLDEAGYEDTDGDGFREDPNGDPLEITYAARAGSEVAEPIAQYYIQAWEEIGLNVSLLEGRLHEVNAFYDRVQGDDPAIDVYEAGWGVGSDPTPDGLYGPNAPFNYPRYESEENNQFLADLVSDESFDDEYRTQVFYDWQEFFMDEAPTIPTFWRTELQLVNDRVSQFVHSSVPGADPQEYGLNQIELLADQPVTE